MFGVNSYEIFVILVVALLVLKPKDFVTILRTFFNIFRKIKSLFNEISSEIDKVDTLKDYNLTELNKITDKIHNKFITDIVPNKSSLSSMKENKEDYSSEFLDHSKISSVEDSSKKNINNSDL